MRGEVNEHAATDVFQKNQASLTREAREFAARRRSRKADDAEVAGVTFQQDRRLTGDGARIVADPRLVGGAHFAQDRAALGNNVRNSEPTADFDQFPARGYNLTTSGQRRQAE